MEKLRLEVENFRAIKKASIRLNGITVLTGENGCGKSTISKLYYYYIKNNLEYKQLLYGKFYSILDDFISTVSDLLDDFDGNIVDENYQDIDRIWSSRRSVDNIQEAESLFNDILLEAKHKLKEKESDEMEFPRLKGILLSEILKGDALVSNVDSIKSIDELFQHIGTHFRSEFIKVNTQLQRRDATFFQMLMHRDFKPTITPPTLFELAAPVLNEEENKLNNIYTIDKLFYIDTPMSFPIQGIHSPFTRHWRELNMALRSNGLFEQEKGDETNLDEVITAVINGEITEGKDAFRNLLQYKRADGLLVDLRESATGIRSFAILELLLTKGLLNNKTLLLIDEPEAHLHPQWIVEYARIIIALNKELGVKFLLASHSPDMISALRYISEKEGTLDQLNFYLAEKEKDSYQYIYNHLGTEIDKIFESFNIAMERISLYGV